MKHITAPNGHTDRGGMGMCTALAWQNGERYFGRTLDLEYHYNEVMTAVPHGTPLPFRMLPTGTARYALLGIATETDGQPLWYDAVNEAGLFCAALNFPHSAVYLPPSHGLDNLASFELIPWVLSQCATVDEACALLARAQIINIPFNRALPPSPLHWFLADGVRAVAIEPLQDGLHIVDDAPCVLTNEPPLCAQLAHLRSFCHLSAEPAVNRFAPDLPLTPHSRGLGAVGLPGDWSSPSRFVRAAFACANAQAPQEERHSVSQCFHMLQTVAVPRGCVRLGEGKPPVTTLYTACYSADAGKLYCVTYDDPTVRTLSFEQGGTVPLFA